MKRDVIIGQKLFETCKLSEFYLNLIVNSRYEDESPFQLAKAYTQKLYEIVERYDRLLEANSQRESLSLQLDNGQQQRSPAVAKPAAKSVCSTPTAVSSHLQQARTSTPNSKYSLASQLQMQLQISQSTPVTPCQSTSASSINLTATAASAHAGVMRQSSSNYQIGAANRRQNVRSTYKLNSVSNSNINSNFYKHNQQRLYSIYYDDYCSTSCSDDDDDDDDDHEVAGYDENNSHNNGELTVRNDDYGGGKFKASRRKSRRDSLDMDSTILSSSNHNHNQHQNDDVRLDDISYDYGEYQHDTQVDLDFRHAGTRYHGNASSKEAKEIEKSYSNLSKDSGVLVDSYHSDYSSPHLNTSVRGSKAAPVTPARKPVVATPAPGKVTTTTTSSSASISDNDETTGDQYIQSANETINYADDDLYDDYEGEHENDEDDFDSDSGEDDDEEDDDEGVSHLCNITDSTHILLKKKATAASKIMAKQHKETPVVKVQSPTTSLYSHYAKNPNKYSPIRASKLAFMPNKSSLISSRSSQSAATVAMATTSGGQEAKLSLIAEKPDSDNNNRQLNLDLDLSMISMMVENGASSSADERRSQSSPKTPTTTSIDQKVKLFSNKIESLTNRLKSDDQSSLSPPLDTSSYSSSSTLSTPSPTSSSSSTAPQSTDESLTTPPPPPSPYSAACSAKTSPFLFNSISSMNVSMLDNIQVTNTSLDFDNMNTSILMFN